MNSEEDYGAFFRHKGAISKQQALAQAELIDDDIDDDIDPLELLGSKSTRGKRGATKTATKTSKKQKRSSSKTLTRSSSNTMDNSRNRNLRTSEVVSIDDDEDNDFEVESSAPSFRDVESIVNVLAGNPEILEAYSVLHKTTNTLSRLRSSTQNSAPNSQSLSQSSLVNLDTEDPEAETIVLQLKEKDRNAITKFKIYKKDQFSKLITNFTKLRNLSASDNVTLKFDALPLKPTETPIDYDMTDQDVIMVTVTRGAVTNLSNSGNATRSNTQDEDDDKGKLREISNSTSSLTESQQGEFIKLKVRVSNKADPLKFKLPKGDTFAKLFDGVCKQLSNNNVKFVFDGDVLNRNSTPEDHDMENDDLIDAIVK